MQITIHMTEEEYDQYATYKKDRTVFDRELNEVENEFRNRLNKTYHLVFQAFDASALLEPESVPQLVDIDAAKNLIDEATDWFS